ncbi:hypothetical protein FOZ63_032107, partial [Perkinsus olseni]
IHGGVASEPLLDLMSLCQSLVDPRGLICIPSFYDDVRAPTQRRDDDAITAAAIAINNDHNNKNSSACLGKVQEDGGNCYYDTVDRLKRTWLLPSLSILDVSTGITSPDGSGGNGHCAHARIIPQSATANISIRFVPNQDARRLINLIDKHIKHEFMKRRSRNHVTIKTTSCWNYWESEEATSAAASSRDDQGEEWYGSNDMVGGLADRSSAIIAASKGGRFQRLGKPAYDSSVKSLHEDRPGLLDVIASPGMPLHEDRAGLLDRCVCPRMPLHEDRAGLLDRCVCPRMPLHEDRAGLLDRCVCPRMPLHGDRAGQLDCCVCPRMPLHGEGLVCWSALGKLAYASS